MGIFEFLSQLFGEDQLFDFGINDGEQYQSLTISKSDFWDAIETAPNLTHEHFSDLIESGDYSSVEHHLKGLTGNLIAEKYFESMGGEIANEVWVDEGRVDLLVSPTDEMELNQLTFDDGNVIMEKFNTTEDFTVEVKTYSSNSYSFNNIDAIADQVSDGSVLSDNNYLGVTEDFLALDPQEQIEIINKVEMSGGKIILLPYDSSSVDIFINNILTNY